MAEVPPMPWSVQRWRQSDAYIDFDLAEQGAYRNLLDEAWKRGGYIPDDDAVLARASGGPLQWPELRARVMGKFVLSENGWSNATTLEAISSTVQGEEVGATTGAERTARWRSRRRDALSVTPVTPSPSHVTSRVTPTRHRKRHTGAEEGVGGGGEGVVQCRRAIDLYNEIFGTKIGYGPGNLKAAKRAFDDGYGLDVMRITFEAVRAGETETARWCFHNNSEFEFLIRPSYKRNGDDKLIASMLDRIPNELATGKGKLVQR
jgi:uncharacterized protein YdaU (DUF1376 family)